MKGLRHVPHEAALLQLHSFSIGLWLVGEGIISMFVITHGLLGISRASAFAPPARHWPHDQGCYYARHRQHAFGFRNVPFWNTLPVEIINAANSFKVLLGVHWLSLNLEIPA